MRKTTILLAAISVLACGKKKSADEAKPAAEAVERAKTVQAAAEPFCREHGVPEAMCTKCNPKLIPIFQAKGDWCSEHGFPESVCPICHPPKGQAPAAGAALEADGAPADGTKVCLASDEAATRAGLQMVKAAERHGRTAARAPVRIAFDATKRAVVNARLAGIVRTIQVDLGARVERGGVLAVLDSAEVSADRSRLLAARTRLQVTETSYQREKELSVTGISSAKDVLAAQQEMEAARSEYSSIAAAVRVAGQNAGGGGAYTLTAPIAGRIVAREATIGKLVGTDEILFEIADTSTMWAEIDIPEDDLIRVNVGQQVVVTVDALRGHTFEGTVAYIAPSVDPQTRTAKARASLPNPEGVLRANMFGEARIVSDDGTLAVALPASAVQRIRDASLVFVRLKPDEFQVRRVELGSREGDLVEVTRGVRAGEEVVAQGSFILKTETLKDSIGDGCADD